MAKPKYIKRMTADEPKEDYSTYTREQLVEAMCALLEKVTDPVADEFHALYARYRTLRQEHHDALTA